MVSVAFGNEEAFEDVAESEYKLASDPYFSLPYDRGR